MFGVRRQEADCKLYRSGKARQDCRRDRRTHGAPEPDLPRRKRSHPPVPRETTIVKAYM
jgi:hypothetical protein